MISVMSPCFTIHKTLINERHFISHWCDVHLVTAVHPLTLVYLNNNLMISPHITHLCGNLQGKVRTKIPSKNWDHLFIKKIILTNRMGITW